MFIDLLHFGSGVQAARYFIFCLVAALGALQAVAARYGRRELQWFSGCSGYVFGAVAVLGSYVWFLLTDEELFIPGLAGGELMVIFVGAGASAVLVTRAVSFLLARLQPVSSSPAAGTSEKEPSA